MNRSPFIPAVVLVEPREEGNIGAAARAMANMGLAELVLVSPEAEIGRLAKAFAVGYDRGKRERQEKEDEEAEGGDDAKDAISYSTLALIAIATVVVLTLIRVVVNP